MNIVDVLIIMFMIIFVLKGLGNGAVKELVTFIGKFLVIILAFLLKNPLSVYMYEHLPFITFSGDLAGITVLNILIYEALAFLILVGVLMVLYTIILRITNIIDKLLKLTVILTLPSKIIGAIIGFLEGVIIIFIILFVCVHIDYTRNYILESKYSETILTETPILGKSVEPIYNAITEILDVAESYKDVDDKNAANLEALDILLKYEILTVDNANTLIENDKLEIDGAEAVISKYEET